MRPHIYPQPYIIAGDEADADRIQVVQNHHWRLRAIDTRLALAAMPLIDLICFGRSALGGWAEAPGPAEWDEVGREESSQNRQLEHDPDFSALHLTA